MSSIPYPWRDQIPALMRRIGCFEMTKREWRFRWGEVAWRSGFALKLCLFEEGYSLNIHPGFGGWFIKLPVEPAREPDEMMESWGFSLYSDYLHLHWGKHSKLFSTPWNWGSCVRHEVLRPDGTWAPYRPEWRGEEDGRAVEVHPYRYLLRSGEVQERTATIYVSEMEWRWHWLKWSPWPRKISRCINVEFSDEVGERSGSWKGGTTGCGYEMRRHETALETLRRMQSERRF